MSPFSVSRDLYGSKAESAITSEVYWVGDADEIDLFLRGSPSTTTVQATLADGRRSAIAENSWSALTTVTAHSGLTALLDIDPFAGWLRCQRSETTEVRLSLDQRTR